jgi:broad specificity phosphatase PhoE
MGQEAADRLGVRLVEQNVSFVGRLRVIGCTMWTDYTLFGEAFRGAAMRTAFAAMADHRRIKWRRKPWARFRPQEARALHLESLAFVERELAKAHDGPTACVFHHGVVPECAHPADRDHLLTAAYVSDLGRTIERFAPELVVTGHTHLSVDLLRGRTRIVSNPAGCGDENAAFDPAFVVELADA